MAQHDSHSLQGLFLKQAALNPGRTAVVAGGEAVTYAKLRQMSGRVAGFLFSKGLQSEEPVVVCLPRRVEMPAAILGILEAGGAYVPVDPGFPAARRNTIVRDSKARFVLITAGSWDGPIPDGVDLCLIDKMISDEKWDAPLPSGGQQSDSLAYVIYTSGSTGTPRGVMVEHRPVINFLRAFDRLAPVSDGFSALSLCPLVFDVSVWEFFSALCYGGTLHLLDPQFVYDIHAFAAYLTSHAIQSAYLPPGILDSLAVELMKPDKPCSLERVLVGVEPILQRSLQPYLEINPGIKIVNGYGPTETTISCTFYLFGGAGEADARTPIGKAVEGYEVFLLDDEMKPCPPGAGGEIYVAGAGLARGYLGDEELTAQRFVPHPLRPATGERAYRTGDMAHYSEEGNLVFEGRRDFQLKIRGNRVEPGEVEARILAFRGVSECVVVGRKSASGSDYLAAFFATLAGEAVDVEKLRESLAAFLPSYMVPSVLRQLDALPRTNAGKIDRGALPETSFQSAAEKEERLNAAEKVMQGIWEEVIGIQPVGAEEDFFMAGGNSIAAARIVARLTVMFGREFPVGLVFAHPTIRSLTAVIEHSPDQFPVYMPATDIPGNETDELSFNQERPYLLEKLNGPGSLYNIAFALDIKGQPDIAAMQYAIDELVMRHGILRTSFIETGGIPRRKVHSNARLKLNIVDLADAGPEAAEAHIQQEAAYAFSVARLPLIRFTLIRQRGDSAVLVLVIHHIIADGWTVGLLFREFAILYNARLNNTSPDLPPPGRDYGSFAQAEKEKARNGGYSRKAEWFARQLADAPPLTELPWAIPRPAEFSFRGASLDFYLSAKEFAQLDTFARSQGYSHFLVLLAALSVVLKTYSGSNTVVVGTMAANRRLPGFENTLGFFANTLPLRIDLDDASTVDAFLGYLQELVVQSLEFEDVPFEYLLTQINPPRRLSFNPLYQVMLVYQNMPLDQLKLEGLEISERHITESTSKVDLSFTFDQVEGRLRGRVNYNIPLFTEAFIRHLVQRFITVLTSIHGNGKLKTGGLNVMTPDDRVRVMEWSSNPKIWDSGETLIRRFRRAAGDTPGKAALLFGDDYLTFGKLEEWSDGFAFFLAEAFKKKKAAIGLVTHRHPDVMVAMLGALKAGIPYVPLQPELPQARLAEMAGEAGVAAIFYADECDLRWSEVPAHRIREASQNGRLRPVPLPEANGEEPAYILFTSGTTGRPKGVVIQQSALDNFVSATIFHLKITNYDRVLQFADLGFDTAAEEIFPALCAGATLVLRDDSLLGGVESFWAKIAAWGISVLDLPTAFWSQLVTETYLRRLSLPVDLRVVVIGGEAAGVQAVNRFLEIARNKVSLVNTYGLTETTVVATAYPFTQDYNWPVVPIGRPIANVEVFVVDESLRALPPGIPGELLIGGGGLAKEYCGQPLLTDEKFTDWVRPDGTPIRVYRSGDKVRFLPDGNLLFLGRVDKQLKIRGYRVEPGEIEFHLRQMKNIRDAVVDLYKAEDGVEWLTAWLVCTDSATSCDDITYSLRRILPDYMIPQAFVKVEKIPVDARGKTDFSHLPAPRPDLSGREKMVLPATPLQLKIHAAWADTLGIADIDIHSSFFSLGGNSILATVLLGRMNRLLGVSIPLRALFASPTIAGVERYLISAAYQPPESFEPIEPSGFQTAVQLSPAQRRIWFLDQLEGSNAAYNIPMEYRITGPFDTTVFEKALDFMVQRHEVLRASIQDFNNRPVYYVSGKTGVKPHYLDFSSITGKTTHAELALFRKNFALELIPLSSPPLFRCAIVRLQEDEHLLFFNFHHLIFDNWSAGIFLKEISSLYSDFLQDNPPGLTSLRLHYSDYIQWVNRRQAGEEMNISLDYWKNKLKGIPGMINLPADFSRQAHQTFNGGEVRLEISRALTARLEDFAMNRSMTLFTVLLSGLAALLQRYSGQDDLVVGCPVAGRNHPDTREIMGVFINTLPIRATIPDGISFSALVTGVNQTWLEAYENQEAPFERIVDILDLKRDLGISPVFQVMFNFLNAHDITPAFEGCSALYRDPGRFVSKYDLSLIVSKYNNAYTAAFEYNTDLFRYSTIRGLAASYIRYLDLLVQSPEVPMDRIDLVSLSDKEKLIFGINPAVSPVPEEAFPALFEKTAGWNPDKIAVSDRNGEMTYAEFAGLVRKYAVLFRDAGLKPGMRVAVLIERSVRLPAVLLAILKSGGIYVPLDPVYPADRIRQILGDAQPGLFVCESSFTDIISGSDATSIWLDKALPPDEIISEWPDIRPEAPAYVIYTSGSTGKPKGVVISHRALVNFLRAMQERPGFEPYDRLLAVTTVSFDIAGLELFLPLLAGGTLVIADSSEAMDARMLADKLVEEHITVLQATPVTFRMLAISGWAGLPGLKVLCGGEALQQDLGNYLVPRCREVWNMYGPTETTIWSSCQKVDFHPAPDGYEPIGRPVANTFFYILDRNKMLVPVGVPGELYIGGEGVALGYYGQPALTEARFYPDPFREKPGARMYQTGDLVKLQPGGTFVYLGRLDNQVKIRGYRIELGEIETCLSALPDIAQCIAVVREDIPNSKRIVAYLVPAWEAEPVKSELRVQLAEQLPDYMIPSAFVLLDRLPLTPNGKVDRNRLPKPETADTPSGKWAEPVTDSERMLVEIWTDLLGIDKAGAEDDFFELGGHSLLAVAMMGRIEQFTRKRIPLSALFNHSRLRDLAAYIDRSGQMADWRSLVRIKPFGNLIPLFLVHGAGLNVLLYNTLVNNLSNAQPVYGLQARGLGGGEKPLSTIEEIAAHYISEIREEYPKGPYALAGFSLGGIIAFEMGRQLQALGEAIAFIGMFDTVAYTSDKHLPVFRQRFLRLRYFVLQSWFNIRAFVFESGQDKSRFLIWKLQSVRRRIKSLRYRLKEKKSYLTGDREKLPEYLHDVHEVNNRALENYILKPSDLQIDLFRANHQTFYIENPESYGWEKYASRGVVVHRVPGEHSTIFWPPHDQELARILQNRLHQANRSFQAGLRNEPG